MKPFLSRLFFAIALLTIAFSGSGVAAIANPSLPLAASGAAAEQSRIYLPLVENEHISLPPIIPETTNVLTTTTTQYLEAVSGDGAVLTFTTSTPALLELAPGDVIVGEPTEASPDGFLRKVASVSFSGGQAIIQTEAASLEDAIQQGVGEVQQVLQPGAVISQTLTQGVAMPRAAQEGEFFTLVLSDVVLYDDDGDPETEYDQILANGEIIFQQSFYFRPVFEGWELISADFNTYLTQTANLEISTNIEIPEIQSEIEIAHYEFAPVTFCIGCPLVFFPVTLNPELAIFVGVDGSVNIGISTGVSQEAVLTGGLEYRNGGWTPVSQFSNVFDYQPPTLSAGLELKGYVGAGLTLKLYGILGPKAEANAYLELNADLLATPWWVLYGGLEFSMGIDMGALSDFIPDYEKTLIDYRVMLAQAPMGGFNFRQQLFDSPSTLFLWITAFDAGTGFVTVNGVDTQQPSTPFTWDWGDGTIEEAWFANSHTYSDRSTNYIVKVTSHYPDLVTDEAEILVRFLPSVITPISLPANLAVTIPDHAVVLGTRLYVPPDWLTFFDDSFFGMLSRTDAEYILSAVAALQYEYANGDVFLIDDGFEQIVLRDPGAGGMYSLWYTNPPSFASGDYGFEHPLAYSSFFHEMGHNFTLNSPAVYYYGGKIDGNANAIFSESMANIFAHTTAYDILNDPAAYGLDAALAVEIEQSATASIRVTRNAYDDYINTGMQFASWNNPDTPEDETFDTFMTIAYQFCAHAENAGQGYRLPLQRMMALLQKFNENWALQYDPYNNTPEAETFRATLMVTALSYAFSTDLRAEFRALNFPISDAVYTALMGAMNP